MSFKILHWRVERKPNEAGPDRAQIHFQNMSDYNAHLELHNFWVIVQPFSPLGLKLTGPISISVSEDQNDKTVRLTPPKSEIR